MMEVNVIYTGDCLEIMSEKIINNSIDLIVTDPPYFIPAKHYETRRNFRRNFGDLGILESFFGMFFKELERILKEDGSFYMFCNGQTYPLFFYYSYFFTKSTRPIIWNKKTAYLGYGWRHQHEIILWGEMPNARKIETGDGDIINCKTVPVNERKHPAEKPIDLIGKLIKKSSKENDIICDPFMGSGTTILAAKKLNRRYIGIEINPQYMLIAENKIDEGNQDLFVNVK